MDVSLPRPFGTCDINQGPQEAGSRMKAMEETGASVRPALHLQGLLHLPLTTILVDVRIGRVHLRIWRRVVLSAHVTHHKEGCRRKCHRPAGACGRLRGQNYVSTPLPDL